MRLLVLYVRIYKCFFLVWQRQQCGGLVSNRLGRNGNSNGSQLPKKTRRRVATIAQRRAANIRERRRMFNLNEAFDKLRRKVSEVCAYS